MKRHRNLMVGDTNHWNWESYQMELMKRAQWSHWRKAGRQAGYCKKIRSPTVMEYLRSTASFSHVAGCAWIASTNIKSWFLKAMTSKSPQRYDPSVAHSMWSEPAVHDIWFNYIIRRCIVRLDNDIRAAWSALCVDYPILWKNDVVEKRVCMDDGFASVHLQQQVSSIWFAKAF